MCMCTLCFLSPYQVIGKIFHYYNFKRVAFRVFLVTSGWTPDFSDLTFNLNLIKDFKELNPYHVLCPKVHNLSIMSWLNFYTNILLKIDHLTLENNYEKRNAEVIIETQQIETHQNLSGKYVDLEGSSHIPKMDWGTGSLAFDICCLCPVSVCFELQFSFMERNRWIQSTVLYKSSLQPGETGWDRAHTSFCITDYLVAVIF